MQHAGVRVLYGMRGGLKVHAKVALVVRRETAGRRLYAYLGTGNFNEDTSRLYADHALLTCDPRLTEEVLLVFRYLTGVEPDPKFEHLLVAPVQMRKRFYGLIDDEIAEARAGRPSGIALKLNSLEDARIIERLYKASQAGVPVRLVVRGLCRLIPGVAALSEGIRATSIVDRFLEHARIYRFHQRGEPRLYLGSADWMQRNLSRRVEVCFPLYAPHVREELAAMLELQLADSTKARVIDRRQKNPYVKASGPARVQAQLDTYRLLEARLNAARGSRELPAASNG
jgi:polyphosphate kinase